MRTIEEIKRDIQMATNDLKSCISKFGAAPLGNYDYLNNLYDELHQAEESEVKDQ